MLNTEPESTIYRFIILLPHRDSAPPLRALRRSLFAAGFPGAYSFPPAVPLAQVSRPWTEGELRVLARELRRKTCREGRDGMMSAALSGGQDMLPLLPPRALRIYGPRLDLPPPSWDPVQFPQAQGGAGFRPFPALLLCAAVLGEGEALPVSPSFPGCLFRAAAVANLSFWPLGSGDPVYSYRWRIGALRWLPRKWRDDES